MTRLELKIFLYIAFLLAQKCCIGNTAAAQILIISCLEIIANSSSSIAVALHSVVMVLKSDNGKKGNAIWTWLTGLTMHDNFSR